MKKIFLLIVAFAGVFSAVAQDKDIAKKKRKEEKRQRINAIIKQEEEGVIKYRKHFVAGFKLTTDGYGGFIEIARAQSVKRALLFQLDITERKHPKEEKLQDATGIATPVIYGKLNFFYPVKLGVQQQFLLGNKGNKNGVSITANAGGGLSLGLLRPYLVEVDRGGGKYEFIKYTQADSALFVNLNSIVGGPNLGKGWSQLELVPGAYAKTGLRFDYGRYNEMVSAVEVGLTAEYYSKEIPQMIYIKQNKFFFSAYVAIVFGRRK